MSYTRVDLIEPCYAEFGEWLAAQRKLLGLAQSDVASLLNINRSSIANIENGKQRVLHHTVLFLYGAMATKKTFERARVERDRAVEDMILLKADQIKRRREV